MYAFWFGLIYGGTALGAMSLLCNDMLITVLAPDEILIDTFANWLLGEIAGQ